MADVSLTLAVQRIWFWQVRRQDLRSIIWFVRPNRSPVSWVVMVWLLLRPLRLVCS